jgi:SAM-dependent methyltransferase
MQRYHDFVRSEISQLLPKTASRILDVGCGIGATANWLKTKYPESWTIGFEGNASLLPVLSDNVDEPHIVDLNGPLPDVGVVDLVLLLDVLEHLIEPKVVLERIVSAMGEGATAIISLPNIAHLSVSIPLLVWGQFDYRDAGILDRTHLHFFNMTSAVDLASSSGLEVTKGLLSGFAGRRTRLIDRLTLGLMRN